MSLEPKSSRQVVVHRVRAREPWVIATFLTLFIPAMLMAVAVGLKPLMLLSAFFSSLFSPLLLVPLWLWSRTKLYVNPQPRAARSSRLGFFVDGGPSLPRGSIAAAFVSPSHPNGAYVRLHVRGGFPIEVWTADVEGAHALVSGLGLDASRVVGIARGASPIAHPLLRVAFGVLAIGVSTLILLKAPYLSLAIPPIALVYAALSVIPRKFVVGADGVLVVWLGRRAFIPLSAIEGVEQRPGVVRLHLRDQRTRDLTVAEHLGDREHVIGLQVGILAERIRSAMRRAGNLQVDASALERGERDVVAWLSSLRDLAGATGYRAAVQREDLVFLAEDAQTKPAVRIAAAVALGAPDEHERARLRIAAESSSLPEVSEAIDAVLCGDEEKLVHALKRVEQ